MTNEELIDISTKTITSSENFNYQLYEHNPIIYKEIVNHCANLLRAIQLPVEQEPIGYFKGDENGDLVWDENCVSSEPVYDFDYGDGFKDVSIPIYRAPPSVAALEKQVAELKLSLQAAIQTIDTCGISFSEESMNLARERAK